MSNCPCVVVFSVCTMTKLCKFVNVSTPMSLRQTPVHLLSVQVSCNSEKMLPVKILLFIFYFLPLKHKGRLYFTKLIFESCFLTITFFLCHDDYKQITDTNSHNVKWFPCFQGSFLCLLLKSC